MLVACNYPVQAYVLCVLLFKRQAASKNIDNLIRTWRNLSAVGWGALRTIFSLITVTTTQDNANFVAVLLFLYAFVHIYTYITTNN